MKHAGLYATIVLFIGISVVLAIFDAPLQYLRAMIDGQDAMSYSLYVLTLMSAVIFMPVTVMPLIPVASGIFGPFIASLLSVTGWTLGAVGAFLVARYLGRPVLERFVDLSRIDTLAAEIPEETRFLYIILLRLTLPVDIVSYALGLTKTVGLVEYTLASFLGVIWFSFAFAYLGDALLSGDTFLFIEVGGASLIVFLTAWYYLKRRQRRRNK